MFHLTVSDAAEAELDEARARYRLAGERVADEFLSEVQEAFARIADTPELFPRHDPRHRLFVLKRHAYVIYYRIENDDTVQVVAVAHAARRPNYWKGR
jgi:plasmid stabilization system protein ParE